MIRASSMERIYLCAGSENACKGLEGKPTEDALSGERVHEAMRLHFEKKPEFVPMFASLDEWESKCVETFISKSKVLFESHGGFEPCGGLDMAICEHEYESCGITANRPKIDLVALCKDGSVHCIDWKSGRGEVERAAGNIQGQVYICTLAHHCDLWKRNGMWFHIFAMGNDGIQSSTFYDEQTIEATHKGLQEVVRRAMAPDAPRIPSSKACRYCLANGNPERCPESCELMGVNTAIVPDADYQAMYQKCLLAEKAIEKFKEWMKEQVKANPGLFPKLKLKTGSTRRTVKDAKKFFEKGASLGWWDADEFILRGITVKIGEIEKVIKTNTKMKTDLVKQLIETELGEYIEKTQSAETLEVTE